MTANHRYSSWSTLRRRPVLIAMMVYAVAYGAASLAVWREATSVSNHRSCDKHYLVLIPAGRVSGNERPGGTISLATRHFSI
jgi:hypothetical protein